MQQEFYFPLEAHSSNDAYSQRGRKRFLVDSARLFKYEIAWWMDIQNCETIDPTGLYKLELMFGFTESVLGTVGDLKKRDASDCIKLIEDTIAEKLGYDDKQNVIVTATKYPTPQERSFIVAKITEVGYTDDQAYLLDRSLYNSYIRTPVVSIHARPDATFWIRTGQVSYTNSQDPHGIIRMMDDRPVVLTIPEADCAVFTKKGGYVDIDKSTGICTLAPKARRWLKGKSYVFARDTRQLYCLKCKGESVLSGIMAMSNIADFV